MRRHATTGRALQWSALFALRYRLVLCGFTLVSTPVLGVECLADRFDEEAQIAFVNDGDTVRLKDGRKVRLAGINTPEVARGEKPSEPKANEAREFVSRLIEEGSQVRLRYEQDRKDRYGRLLAHVYLRDGSSIQERLLAEGLAFQLVVPPNGWQGDCYLRIERRAREQRRGVWSVDHYQPLRRAPTRESDGAFRFVAGTVIRVGESRKSVWLNLDSGVALRIPRADLRQFDRFDPRSLKGEPMVARGWLNNDGGQFQMTLRHPSALMKESEWKR